jgi:hypothetical protein
VIFFCKALLSKVIDATIVRFLQEFSAVAETFVGVDTLLFSRIEAKTHDKPP